MTALLIIAIIVASLAAYLGVGVALARRDLPRSIAANTYQPGEKRYREYGTAVTYYVTTLYRPAVRSDAALMVWFWPILAPYRAYDAAMDRRLDRYDPAITRALEADLERLQTKINQLKASS